MGRGNSFDGATAPAASSAIAPRRSDRWVLLAVALAVASCMSAMGLLWRYKNTAGAKGVAPQHWPTSSRVAPPTDRPVLVMFAHPLCPCTSASLAELRVLQSRCGDRVRTVVLFALPDDVGEEWRHGAAWNTARSLAGVEVCEDVGQRESELFGALTSGQVVVYTQHGTLAFCGGITSARGHQGENNGLQRAIAAVEGRGPDAADYPVFGCALRDQTKAGGQCCERKR